eukprot:TRINITY_DN121552_c0_g1_i1.p1 TRINITY_DN121552_c0_g1~~TRINITY_DN121552_c0_g1_i1.p1  ORF type:complete len:452 (+),score=120.65 TRINITY_DN121552_c0_g1_i1:93-1448(+)
MEDAGPESAGPPSPSSMMPVKVVLNENFQKSRPRAAHNESAQRASSPSTSKGYLGADFSSSTEPATLSEPWQAAKLGGSTEWLRSVQRVLPFLDKAGARQALHILDVAVELARQGEALDKVIGRHGAMDVASTYFRSAAQQMRRQVDAQQRALLADLESLRYTSSAFPPKMPPFDLAAYSAAQMAPFTGQLPVLGGSLVAPLAGCATAARDDEASCAWRGSPHQGHLPRQSMSQRSGKQDKHQPQHQGGAHQNHNAASFHNAPPGAKCEHTLSTSLQLLAEVDVEHIFIVRRINKLGFKAMKKLKEYFSKHGTVVRVLLAHSTVKSGGLSSHGSTLRRPASLGFVQMSAAAEVAAVLALASEHIVDGVPIRLQKFERKVSEAGEANEQEGEVQDGDDSTHSSADTTSLNASCCGGSGDDNMPRQATATSDASTCASSVCRDRPEDAAKSSS